MTKREAKAEQPAEPFDVEQYRMPGVGLITDRHGEVQQYRMYYIGRKKKRVSPKEESHE
jgi:hypothetical protein